MAATIPPIVRRLVLGGQADRDRGRALPSPRRSSSVNSRVVERPPCREVHRASLVGRVLPSATGAGRCWAGADAGSVPAMAVTVRIPTTLRPMSGGKSEVQVEGATLGRGARPASTPPTPASATASSTTRAALRRFVNVFVADDDVRYLQGLDTPVPDGETVAIIPAVAGG